MHNPKKCLLNPGEIRPHRRNLLTALSRETNLKCLLLTVLVLASSAATIVWCTQESKSTGQNLDQAIHLSPHDVNVSNVYLSNPIPKAITWAEVSPDGSLGSVCGEGKVLMPTALILLLYLLYLVECWHSKAREMIARPKIDVNSVYRKVEEMRRARPIVWWQAICYHFERKTKQFARYRHPDASPSSHVSCDLERVNTHTATSSFFYGRNGVRDISRDLVDLEDFAVTHVQFKKAFIFHDAQSSTDFQDQRAIFFQDMEEVDVMVEMREGMELAKVTTPERMTCWADAEEPPWYGRLGFYWFCSFLLLSWPLRVVLEFNTAHLVYQVTKLFGTHCDCSEQPETIDTSRDGSCRQRGEEAGHREWWFTPSSSSSQTHWHQHWLPRFLEFCKSKIKTFANSKAYDVRIRNLTFDPDDETTQNLIPPEATQIGRGTVTAQEQLENVYTRTDEQFRHSIGSDLSDPIPRSVTLVLNQSEFQCQYQHRRDSVSDRLRFEPYDYGCCADSCSDFGLRADNSSLSTLDCNCSLVPSHSQARLFMGGQSETGNEEGNGNRNGNGSGSSACCSADPYVCPGMSGNKFQVCEVMTPVTCEGGLYTFPDQNSGPADLYPSSDCCSESQKKCECQSLRQTCSAYERPGNLPPRSISVFDFNRMPRSESFQVLRSRMPRSATGVTIDLTVPVSASFSRDQNLQLLAESESEKIVQQQQQQSQPWTNKLRRSLTTRDFNCTNKISHNYASIDAL